ELDIQALYLARTLVALSLLGSLAVLIAVTLLMTWQLVIPLGRLVQKTIRISNFPFRNEELSGEDMTVDEPGEWYDLERALNKLGQDLRNKTIRLSREKTELRAIMASVSEAILAVSADKRPLFYNSQFALMSGIQEFD